MTADEFNDKFVPGQPVFLELDDGTFVPTYLGDYPAWELEAEVVELRSRLALDELLEERQEMESLATGNSLD